MGPDRLWSRLVDFQQRTGGEVRRREPAPAGVPLILTWSGAVTAVGSGRYDSGFVAGPTDRWTDTVSTGRPSGVQVDLTWWGARLVLGLPLADLTRRQVAVGDVWGLLAGGWWNGCPTRPARSGGANW